MQTTFFLDNGYLPSLSPQWSICINFVDIYNCCICQLFSYVLFVVYLTRALDVKKYSCILTILVNNTNRSFLGPLALWIRSLFKMYNNNYLI